MGENHLADPSASLLASLSGSTRSQIAPPQPAVRTFRTLTSEYLIFQSTAPIALSPPSSVQRNSLSIPMVIRRYLPSTWRERVNAWNHKARLADYAPRCFKVVRTHTVHRASFDRSRVLSTLSHFLLSPKWMVSPHKSAMRVNNCAAFWAYGVKTLDLPVHSSAWRVLPPLLNSLTANTHVATRNPSVLWFYVNPLVQ